jgi:hypothetical protein
MHSEIDIIAGDLFLALRPDQASKDIWAERYPD